MADKVQEPEVTNPVTDTTDDLLEVNTLYTPTHCTAVLLLGKGDLGLPVKCGLPRHRGRHERKLTSGGEPEQVVIRWKDKPTPAPTED